MHYRTPFFSVITFGCFISTVSVFIFIFTLTSFTAKDARAEAVRALQWEITADKLTRFEDPASVIAEGNVVLQKIETVTGTAQAKPEARDWSDLLGEDAVTDRDTGNVKAKEAEKGLESGETEEEQEVGDAKEETLLSPKTAPVMQEADVPPEEAEPPDAPETEQGENRASVTASVMTTIQADWIVYDVDLGTVKLRGNVLIDIGPDKISAAEGVVHLNRETGTFQNATVLRQYKDMRIKGRVIEKTGDLTYHIEDGWVITCKLKKGEIPPWSFHADDAEITDGGYAYLKGVTFRVKDTPVLYSPVLLLPAKRSRQTGLLFPSVSLSDRDGFSMEWPLFINLSPSSDITLYPHYFAERGFMAGAEMRYVLDQHSKGTIMGNFLDDDLSDINDPANDEYYSDGGYTHTNQERYWFRSKADQKFGEWITRLDLDFVSDQDYLTEFTNGFSGFSASDRHFSEQFGRGLQDRTIYERENKLTALRSWSNGTSLETTLKGIDDLLEEQRTETDASPLWKFPEINYSGLLPVYETDVDFSWDADYVYYKRDLGVEAQRIDLHPRLKTSVPMLSEYLETTVGAGLRETLYAIDDNGVEEWQDSDTESRLLADFDAEIGTTLRRDFSLNSGKITGWSHTLRPFLRYNYVTDPDEENLPRFDSVDTAGNRNSMTYGVNNFFYLSRPRSSEEFERDYGYIKIQQSYDLRSETDEEPLSPIKFRLAWNPLTTLNFKYLTDLNVYDDGFTRHSIEGDYRNSRGDLLSVDYLFNAAASEEAEDASSIRLVTRVGLLYNIAVGYSLEQSIEDSVTISEKINLIYSPSCWSVELAADVTPDNEQIMVMFKLANIGAPFGIDLMPGN